MCNTQKPITPREIEDIKTELKWCKTSLERLMCKLETSGWTKEDIELANRHQQYIKEHAPIVKQYYAPAVQAE